MTERQVIRKLFRKIRGKLPVRGNFLGSFYGIYRIDYDEETFVIELFFSIKGCHSHTLSFSVFDKRIAEALWKDEYQKHLSAMVLEEKPLLYFCDFV
jgi:hypothetical protein